MKIIASTTFATLMWSALVAAGQVYEPRDTHDQGTHHSLPIIKSVANFGNASASVELCPGGDCESGQAISVSLLHVEEIDQSEDSVGNSVEDLDTAAFDWSDFKENEICGTPVTSTSCDSLLDVGTSGQLQLNVTASIFEDQGNFSSYDTWQPPAGALMFSLSMGEWPFMNSSNGVEVALKVGAKGFKALQPPRIASVDEFVIVDLREGMVVHLPRSAVVDGAAHQIWTRFDWRASMEISLYFPHYVTSVMYNPVFYSVDASAQPEMPDKSGKSSGKGSHRGSHTGSSSSSAAGAGGENGSGSGSKTSIGSKKTSSGTGSKTSRGSKPTGGSSAGAKTTPAPSSTPSATPTPAIATNTGNGSAAATWKSVQATTVVWCTAVIAYLLS